ncbi:hypothetical protein FisN_2Hh204 [Fistulifera solaris]|uniref:Uncharacterized protein n=1 Tax=Fistulifera solaris TaxID=1519565 RepID=A0A1Z5KKC9_FISSO|nr:hypothetical protein FisN_2Hh204 [Fistulifera solaris]|eukprot:GAX26378.1 hypothetical protein FisN_2Hh204 [Fistulifera solaris]
MSLKSPTLTRSAVIKSIHIPQTNYALTAASNSMQQRFFGARNKPSKKDEKRMRKIVSQETQQQQDWVDVQQSLSIGAFPGKAGVSARATKKAKQSAVEAAAERQRLTKAGGGLYPPLRYSPEETELLLKEAYDAVPARAGKRGTREAKRQGRRWQAVRKIRKKYKKLLVRAHHRKMEKRSLKVAQVKAVLAEAPDIVKRDREYQAEVFRRWAQTMLQSVDKNQEGSISAAEVEN